MESNRFHQSNLAQTTTSILTMVKSHLDGWRPSLIKTQAKLNIIKDGKTCMTLTTTWLSMTTQYNPNPEVCGLGTVLNHAGQCVY
jgi:hypothetical protein